MLPDKKTRKMIQDYVNILAKREDMTKEMISKEVFETFGVPFELETVQERRKAKELTAEDLKDSNGFLPMFKEGETMDMTTWEDKYVYKDAK